MVYDSFRVASIRKVVMSSVTTYSPELATNIAAGVCANAMVDPGAIPRRGQALRCQAEPAVVSHGCNRHFARPARGGNFDFLAVNVPATFQQGSIADGEEPPWGELRIVSTAR